MKIASTVPSTTAKKQSEGIHKLTAGKATSMNPRLLLLAALLPPLAALHAADWPQWGGTESKNMVSWEKHLPETFTPGEKGPQGDGILLATTANVRWAARIGAFSCATPAVAGGRVFIGGMIGKQGVMSCFDEATGSLLWRWSRATRTDFRSDAMTMRLGPQMFGVSSTPTVDGERLYFVDQNAMVECLDVRGEPPIAKGEAGEPKVIWTFDMYGDKAVGTRPSDACNGSPLIDGDLLYVTTSNGVDRIARGAVEIEATRRCMAPIAPNLIVLDKRTGRFLAKDTAPIVDGMLHGQWSSPSIGTVHGRKLVFLGAGNGVCYAFEALTALPNARVSLKTVWWADCNPAAYRYAAGVDAIRHYVLGDIRRKDTLNSPNDGSFVGTSEIIATPVFYKDRVYLAIGRDPEHGRGRGALVCLDAAKSGDSTKTGKLWTYEGLDRSLSTVSIADGLLYIADVAGRLHCLDAETGQAHWVYDSQSRVIASTMVADGKIYLATEKHLNILATGTELKLLNQIALGSPAWGTPVAANGTVFVPSRNYLWAVQEQGAGK